MREIENSLWANVPDTMSRIHPVLIEQKISEGLNTAESLGLTDDHGLYRFVESQLLLGDRFWQHEVFKDTWNQAKTDAVFVAQIQAITQGLMNEGSR